MEKEKRLIASLSLVIFLFFAYVSASRDGQTPYNQPPKHFVLVHKACSGAWSWYKTVSLLKLAGYNVTTIDLGASGINLARVTDIKSFSDYSKPLIDFMGSLDANEKVLLVAHSIGGASISQAMELFPEKIQMAVFVTAFMPGPSLPYSDLFDQVASRLLTALDNKATYDNGPNNPPTIFIFGPKYISQFIFPRSPSEEKLLYRPLSLATRGELVLTEAKYGSVKRVYIICEQDQVLPIDFQRFMIDRNPPHKVLTIRGSDHSVMTSQPNQLAAHLRSISSDFA